MVAAFEKASGKVISYYFSSSSPRSHESSTQPDFLIFQKIPLKMCPRRPGDATAVYASTDKAEKELGWKYVPTIAFFIFTCSSQFHDHYHFFISGDIINLLTNSCTTKLKISFIIVWFTLHNYEKPAYELVIKRMRSIKQTTNLLCCIVDKQFRVIIIIVFFNGAGQNTV